MGHIIISIGRQFGGGGRSIGLALAQRLGFEYYDKELLTLAAKEYGLTTDVFETKDEQSFSFLEKITDWFGQLHMDDTNNILSGESLFKMQSDTIKRLASEKSCIIVGRCSDYVLRDNPNCVSIFLHSSDEDRIGRICKRTGISEDEAKNMMMVEDRKRANYYNFFSNKTWGDSATYNLSIEVSQLGEEKTLELIIDYLQMRFPELKDK